ncbi:Multi-sensor signal transduction histidine [Arthrobacter sp. 9V]|nr:Multi-sensor signal transduction histidine [Arthrobacter sp. 9V]
MAAVPGGNLQGVVNVVNRESYAVHTDLVGKGRMGLDRVRMQVFEEFKLAIAIRGLEHRNFRVVAVQPNRRVSPLSADRVSAQYRKAEIREEGDRFFKIPDRDADVLKFDSHALKLPRRVG